MELPWPLPLGELSEKGRRPLETPRNGEDDDHLKLIDFGFAKFWDRSRNMTQACGSTHYVAPEVLGNSYTLKADLWSLGVISYMLLTGTAPRS